MKSLTSSDRKELVIHERVPALFVLHTCGWRALPMVAHYPTDLQVAAMHHETQQYINKGREEDCKLANMDANNTMKT